MSDHSDGDFGQIELDAAERADAEINLDEPSAGDDEPWSPPDRQPRGAEMAEVEDETLSMRLRQEEPDPTAAYDLEGSRSSAVTTRTRSRPTRTSSVATRTPRTTRSTSTTSPARRPARCTSRASGRPSR